MDYSAIAAKLLKAERDCQPIDALTKDDSSLSVEDAYQIQLAGMEMKLKAGDKIVGKKIGLTSKGMQKLLGVDEPDYGFLYASMLIPEGGTCIRAELHAPKIEGELAFVLKERLRGPGVTIADVMRATIGVMPAFEIVDTRIKDWKIKLPDTVADNASSARFVLGSRMVPVADLDLRLIGMVLEKNGELASSDAGAEVWGHPAASVAWLANKLADFDIALEAGEIILSGAVTAAEACEVGDVFTLSFAGLGSLTVAFT